MKFDSLTKNRHAGKKEKAHLSTPIGNFIYLQWNIKYALNYAPEVEHLVISEAQANGGDFGHVKTFVQSFESSLFVLTLGIVSHPLGLFLTPEIASHPAIVYNPGDWFSH